MLCLLFQNSPSKPKKSKKKSSKGSSKSPLNSHRSSPSNNSRTPLISNPHSSNQQKQKPHYDQNNNSDHSDSSNSSDGVVLPAVTVPKNYDGNLSSIGQTSSPPSINKEPDRIYVPEIVKICIDSPSEEEHSYTKPSASENGAPEETTATVVGIKYNGTIV